MIGPGWIRSILGIVAVVLVAYGGLCALMYLFQNRLLYFPWKTITSRPSDLGVEYRDVRFRTEDGLTLNGWFAQGEPGKPVVLVCHGNAGNLSNRVELIYVYRSLGYGVFVFDYRGYGESEGTPDEQGTYRDAAAAWDYLVDNSLVSPKRIVLLGRSLGGPVAAWLAGRKRPAALILESTFTSVPDLAGSMYPLMPVRLLARNRYETIRHTRDVTCPVLVVHSRQDDVVPFTHGARLFQAAEEPKEFLEIEGPHDGGYLLSGATYLDGVSGFIDRHVGRQQADGNVR